jgi:hypothetical protein
MNMSVARVALTVTIWLVATRSTIALPPFRKPLEERYAKNDVNLRSEFRRVNCDICHVKNKDKRFVNAYGKLLADLIPGNVEDRLMIAASIGNEARAAEYALVMHELSEAIKRADVLPDSAAITYGDSLRSHKLPAGDEFHALCDD